jgi:hypothetical protein
VRGRREGVRGREEREKRGREERERREGARERGERESTICTITLHTNKLTFTLKMWNIEGGREERGEVKGEGGRGRERGREPYKINLHSHYRCGNKNYVLKSDLNMPSRKESQKYLKEFLIGSSIRSPYVVEFAEFKRLLFVLFVIFCL